MPEELIEEAKSLEEFLRECEKKTAKFNEKISHTLLTLWRILRLLLDKQGLEGFSSQEIIDRLNKENKFRSEPTIHKSLEQLRIWGIVDRPEEKRWIANKTTGAIYKRINDIIPNIHKTQNWAQDVIDIKYFDNVKITLDGRDFLLTGSALLNDFTNKKDIKKILASGEVVELRASIIPAGGQPPKL